MTLHFCHTPWHILKLCHFTISLWKSYSSIFLFCYTITKHEFHSSWKHLLEIIISDYRMNSIQRNDFGEQSSKPQTEQPFLWVPEDSWPNHRKDWRWEWQQVYLSFFERQGTLQIVHLCLCCQFINNQYCHRIVDILFDISMDQISLTSILDYPLTLQMIPFSLYMKWKHWGKEQSEL